MDELVEIIEPVENTDNIINVEYAGSIYSYSLTELRTKGIPEADILAACKGNEFKGKIGEVYNKAKRVLYSSAGQYCQFEAARWSQLESEASDHIANGTAYDSLTNGSATGQTATEYAQEVVLKASLFKQILFSVRKARADHVNAINALTVSEDVLAYDITTGWPV